MKHVKGDAITWWQGGDLDKWGNPSYTVHTLFARWEDSTSTYFGSDGREYRSRSMVGVDIDMSIGDYIAKGHHPEAQAPIPEAQEIKDFRKTPNWNYTKFDRWAIV